MPSYYGGVTLSREQTAQVAYAAGARGDDLIFLTAIPQRESSYNAGAHRTDAPRSRLSGDRGLWQINYRWDRELMNAGIIRQPSDLFDPMVNARAAVYVLRKQGRAAWGMGSNGWAAGGDPMKGASWDAAAQAVSRAGAQGLLGQDWQSGPSAASPGQAGGGTTGPVGLPRDARIVQVGGKAPVVVFNLMPGLFIYYTGNFNASGRPVERITQAQWNKKYGGRTPFAGDVEELKSIPSGFGSYKEFWNSIVNQVIGSSNPARNDPEIMRVIAEIAGRPDMSAAEIENRLKATKYYQRRTEGELQWNSLSEAERAAQRKETEARMVDAVLQYVGIPASRAAGTKGGWVFNNTIKAHVEAVASGKMGFGAWVASVVKPFALKIPESPWKRTLRDETEAQRQRPIDIENTARRVRETARKWGLPWSEAMVQKWGREIVEGTKSDKDLLDTMEALARGVFPGLPEGVDTETFAAQYTDSYRQILEKEGSVFTPEVQRALRAGKTVMDFERELTMTPEWQGTKNADQRAHALLGQVGELFGYVENG